MQARATEEFKMRVSEQDKKMIAYVAKHFNRKQSQIGRDLFRAAYEVIKAEKSAERNVNPKQLSPA